MNQTLQYTSSTMTIGLLTYQHVSMSLYIFLGQPGGEWRRLPDETSRNTYIKIYTKRSGMYSVYSRYLQCTLSIPSLYTRYTKAMSVYLFIKQPLYTYPHATSVQPQYTPQYTLIEYTLIEPQYTLIRPLYTLIHPQYILIYPQYTLIEPVCPHTASVYCLSIPS